MKRSFILILALFLSSCGSRKLNGVYCHVFNGGDDASCLSFNKDNRFTYKTSGDLGTYITGKGSYTLKSNLLKLIFDKDSVVQKSEVTIEDWSYRDEKATDSIDLVFKVIDGHNKELPLYGAYIVDESKDINNSEQKDFSGKGTLTITRAKSTKTEFFRIGSIFYESIEVPLKHDFSKEISVTLYRAQPHKISDTIHLYSIENINRNSFVTDKGHLYKKAE